MTNLKIEKLTKIIHKNIILQDVTLSMNSGKIYGLQGINGSGKTMLMRAIIGLIHPSSGKIFIDGKQLGKEIEFPESIGFLLENPAFLDRYSGLENLLFLARIRNQITEKQIREVLLEVGLNPEERKKYRKYSLGMKQRLGIAAAVMEEPDMIVLDEPTNALDTDGIELLKNILKKQKERGALTIISCHDLGILQELSDEVICMEAGKVKEHIGVEKTEGN